VCYACLTGRPPFAEQGWGETAVAHLSLEPPPPDRVSSGISAELSWAVLTALAKRPTSRPTTATAYANILRVAVTA
jgi:serine/threonine-protein kinase